MKPEISSDNQIGMYTHCSLCLQEKPAHKSPQEWARLEVGTTPRGIQVWCSRHNCNVLNIDFEGQKHPAITARKLREGESANGHH